MRKLTPEQARWVEARAYDLREAGTHGAVASFQEALDEARAWPGDEEYCKGCAEWRDYRGRLSGRYGWHCSHLDFDDQTCPIGRWG